VTKEIVSERLAATRKKLDAISASVGKDSPESQSRTVLQRQIELLEQELGLIAKAEAQTAQKAGIEDRLRKANELLAALSAESAPQPPAAADKKGFETFSDNVD
jgi:hypothetical protein